MMEITIDEVVLADLRDAETTEEILHALEPYRGQATTPQSMAVVTAAGRMLEKRVEE